MTDYECEKVICDTTDKLAKLLRNEKDETINNTPSVRGKLSEASKVEGKKWVNTSVYKKNDIVALDSIIYICTVENSYNKDPRIYRDNWTLLVLSYNTNQSKVKAFCRIKILSDGTTQILHSYNIRSFVNNYEDNDNVIEFAVDFETLLNEDEYSVVAQGSLYSDPADPGTVYRLKSFIDRTHGDREEGGNYYKVFRPETLKNNFAGDTENGSLSVDLEPEFTFVFFGNSNTVNAI